MSFILDALRKSETERQRQSGPGLVDPGYRPPASRRGIWLPLLVIVLLANLGLMAYFWQRQAPPAEAPATPVAAAIPAAAAPTQPPPPVTQALADAAGVTPAAETEYTAMADLPAVDAEPYTETLEPPAPPEADAAPSASDASPSHIQKEAIPSAEQLIATGALSGTPMHLDIHVYSSNPAERFVFINMRKYTEGTELPEGPRLEEITPEGAIFTINGQRFQLARD